MDPSTQSDPAAGKAVTTERASDRELVITRTVDAPAPLVFQAWATPELFRRWWTPKSFGIALISYEAEIRTGGFYRLVMAHPSMDQPMTFFGRYLDVTPHSRMVWTNDEAGEDGQVTTVTFEEKDGATKLVVTERFPTKEAMDEAIASGATSGWGEQFAQLDELISTLDAKL